MEKAILRIKGREYVTVSQPEAQWLIVEKMKGGGVVGFCSLDCLLLPISGFRNLFLPLRKGERELTTSA